MAGKRKRLDELLVELGYFKSLSETVGPVMTGSIRVNDQIVTKVGQQVAFDAEIAVKGQDRFASRGGYKLEHALASFGIDVKGNVVLDAGASTGGFTDCLLQRGASRVYAVDVGYGQLRGRLAANDRVVVLEKTNISDLPGKIGESINMCTADLSYLTLTKAIPILVGAVGKVPMVCLVKPLYEGLDEDQKASRHAILDVARDVMGSLIAMGHGISATCVSPIFGGRGAVEFLVHVTHDVGEPLEGLVAQLREDWDNCPPS